MAIEETTSGGLQLPEDYQAPDSVDDINLLLSRLANDPDQINVLRDDIIRVAGKFGMDKHQIEKSVYALTGEKLNLTGVKEQKDVKPDKKSKTLKANKLPKEIQDRLDRLEG